MAQTAVAQQILGISVRAIFRDFEFVHGFENHEPVHVKHGKCMFVPRGENLSMRTINFDLITQKGDDNRTQKFSYYLHI